MANTFEQKYPNNIRTISGLANTPFQDDVVLNCDTTAGAVVLNLLDIPTDKWSTQYKLYVVDSRNNAAVNNITINAPVGFTINGASSFVINSNGASLLIRIANNSAYVGQYSVISAGGSGYNAIQLKDDPIAPQRGTIDFIKGDLIDIVLTDDAINNRTKVEISAQAYETTQNEGVNLPQRKIIDFVGANVEATDDGVSKTIVTISDKVAGGLQVVIDLSVKTLPIAPLGIRRTSDGTTFNSANGLAFDFKNQFGSFVEPIFSGNLIVGMTYTITNYVVGDDFTNVGGTNISGNTFVAIGTTPLVWTNLSMLTPDTFNMSTGAWTCPETGYYNFTTFIGLIANGASGSENNILPNYYQGNGTANANLEVIPATPHNVDFNEYIGSFGIMAGIPIGNNIASNIGTSVCHQQVPIYFDNSVINISGTYTARNMTKGQFIICKFLNKTQLIGGGQTGNSFHFSVQRIF
jgi:hypothetical protein